MPALWQIDHVRHLHRDWWSLAWRHKIDLGEHGTFDLFGRKLEFEAPNRYVRSDVINVPVMREAISTETTTFVESEGVTIVELVDRQKRDLQTQIVGLKWKLEYSDEAKYDA